MSPAALALAVLLHALVVVALWWLSLDRFHVTPAEEVIEITLEQPKPPEPPPQQQALQTPPPLVEGLRPPAEITADKPTQAMPVEVSKEPPAPPPPPLQQARPLPQAEPPPSKPSELAKPVDPPLPRQQALAVPQPPRPTPHAPAPEHRPSPLSTAPQRRPPSAPAPVDPPSQHRFVNPADAYSRARVSDNYLWQVARKLSGYRYQARTSANEGLTVVRVTIARDGRLLDVSVARSSGIPEFDQGVVAGVRAGSPYSPLPPEIAGDRATFTLPLVSSRR